MIIERSVSYRGGGYFFLSQDNFQYATRIVDMVCVGIVCIFIAKQSSQIGPHKLVSAAGHPSSEFMVCSRNVFPRHLAY